MSHIEWEFAKLDLLYFLAAYVVHIDVLHVKVLLSPSEVMTIGCTNRKHKKVAEARLKQAMLELQLDHCGLLPNCRQKGKHLLK